MHCDKYVVLLYGKLSNTLKKQLDGIYEFRTINSFNDLFTKNNIASIMFIDAEILFADNFKNYDKLRKHKSYIYFPIIAVGENLTNEQKMFMVKKDIQRVVDISKLDGHIVDKIDRILKSSNLYTNTCRDTFVRAFIGYEKLKNSIASYLYLAKYLLYHYDLDARTAADIRLSIIFLMIGYEKNKLREIKKLLREIHISNYIISLIDNYENPNNLEKAIIFCSVVANSPDLDEKVICKEMAKGPLKPIFETILDAIDKNKIVIEENRDLDIFWERLSEVLFLDEKIDWGSHSQTLTSLYKFLVRVVVLFGSIEVEFYKVDNLGYKITLLFLETDKILKDDILFVGKAIDINIENEYKHIGDNQFEIFIPYYRIENKDNKTQESIVKREKIDTMHYNDMQKISATVFVEETGVDYDLLDDLNEYTMQTLNNLDMYDGLSQSMIDELAKVYEFFSKMFYSTIEFEDLGYTLLTLSKIVREMELNSYNELELKTIKKYLAGILNDLNEWKEHIYITKETNDIHYLDASLLENAAEIEKLIKKEEIQEEDGDLEFF